MWDDLTGTQQEGGTENKMAHKLTENREWKKLVEKQLHMPHWVDSALKVACRLGYQDANMHPERSPKRKMHRMKSARNCVWMGKEGWERERGQLEDRGRLGGKHQPLTLLSVTCIAWKIFLETLLSHFSRTHFLIFTKSNFYSSAVLYWALS